MLSNRASLTFIVTSLVACLSAPASAKATAPFESLCKSGEIQACQALAFAYELGVGRERDLARADQYYRSSLALQREACERSLKPRSCAALSDYYVHGRGVVRDPAKPRAILSKLHERHRHLCATKVTASSCEFAMALAPWVFDSDALRAFQKKFKPLLLKALSKKEALELGPCKKGDLGACRRLTGVYKTSGKASPSLSLGIEALTKRCLNREVRACLTLAREPGSSTTAGQKKLMWSKLVAFCKVGHAASCGALARMNLEAGAKVDHTQNIKLATSACAAGAVNGCRAYADHLGRGLGIQRDLPKAASIYKKLCRANDAMSCHNAGVVWAMRHSGKLLHVAKAIPYWKRACELKEPRGCQALGRALRGGDGIERDFISSTYYFERGCSLGDRHSCFETSKAYDRGVGVLIDGVKARRLMGALQLNRFDKSRFGELYPDRKLLCFFGDGRACAKYARAQKTTSNKYMARLGANAGDMLAHHILDGSLRNPEFVNIEMACRTGDHDVCLQRFHPARKATQTVKWIQSHYQRRCHVEGDLATCVLLQRLRKTPKLKGKIAALHSQRCGLGDMASCRESLTMSALHGCREHDLNSCASRTPPQHARDYINHCLSTPSRQCYVHKVMVKHLKTTPALQTRMNEHACSAGSVEACKVLSAQDTTRRGQLKPYICRLSGERILRDSCVNDPDAVTTSNHPWEPCSNLKDAKTCLPKLVNNLLHSKHPRFEVPTCASEQLLADARYVESRCPALLKSKAPKPQRVVTASDLREWRYQFFSKPTKPLLLRSVRHWLNTYNPKHTQVRIVSSNGGIHLWAAPRPLKRMDHVRGRWHLTGHTNLKEVRDRMTKTGAFLGGFYSFPFQRKQRIGYYLVQCNNELNRTYTCSDDGSDKPFTWGGKWHHKHIKATGNWRQAVRAFINTHGPNSITGIHGGLSNGEDFHLYVREDRSRCTWGIKDKKRPSFNYLNGPFKKGVSDGRFAPIGFDRQAPGHLWYVALESSTSCLQNEPR